MRSRAFKIIASPGAVDAHHWNAGLESRKNLQQAPRALEDVRRLEKDEDIDVCVVPGARFPPGARLPEGFPYCWLGLQTTEWAGVGVLIRLEVQSAVSTLDELGSNRILWLRVAQGGPGATHPLLLCAVYGAPGGDVATWAQVVGEFQALRKRYPRAHIMVAGDANIQRNIRTSFS